MVLQRETSAPIWGTAEAGERITVMLNGQAVSAVADSRGNWSATFEKLSAGGPFTLTIKGEKSAPVSISNVAVGDVWLCSGQSNMTLPVAAVKDFDPDVITSATDPLIRCYTAGFFASATPLAGKPGTTANAELAAAEGGDIGSSTAIAGEWKPTSPRNVGDFTAMGYYFARYLRADLGVPIGILHISYGGAASEAWTSREGLAALGLGGKVDEMVKEWQDADELGEKFLTGDLAAWEAKYGRGDTVNKGAAAGWADPAFADSDWTVLPELGDWKSLNLPNGGIIWARREIDLPAGAAGKDIQIALGNLMNTGMNYGNVTGIVYFNGKVAGVIGHKLQHLFSGSDGALVTVPGTLVKAGKNMLAVRIVDQRETGPLFGGKKFKLEPRIDPKDWATPWKAKMESAFPPMPPAALASRPQPPVAVPTVQVPTVLYNGMLSPVIPYGIKGVLWDQGTSDAYGTRGAIYEDRAANYEKLLTALIQDWRTRWSNSHLPFVFTQHPNIGSVSPQPPVSALSQIRDAELRTWKSTPDTYMAVMLGLVVDQNIHFKNKKEAGRRLALAALAGVYGRNIEYSGPVYDSMTIEGNKVRLKFTHLDGGLIAKGGGPLKTFSIAGADKKFVWADAVIDGDTVLVSSSQVPNPVAVRYAWADNPVGFNLYNKAGLPAPTFRTDDWYWRVK
ncbi:MAG TPA: sialate O-acetylesterase [Chthoniobacteraceae bacterium]|nr:sialate O-acetylesterase [Chthoniobacteraceae bacterium]